MLIRPELRALRGDDAPQRAAQRGLLAVRKAWRDGPIGSQTDAELTCFGSGSPLDDLPLLSCLFAPDADGAAAALRFVEDQILPLIGHLSAHPLCQAPIGFATGDVLTTLVLARQGSTVLSVQMMSGAGLSNRPKPESVSFAPVETHERVLSGTGRADHVCLQESGLHSVPIRLVPGDVRCRYGSREAVVFTEVFGSLALLKLQRRLGPGHVSREHRLSDGRLMHQAAGSPDESRLELTANLLGRMGRSDAAPLLAAITEEHGGESLRWQALRECLSLDSAIGFSALCRIARNEADPLAISAEALRIRLLQSHPALAGVSPCPG